MTAAAVRCQQISSPAMLSATLFGSNLPVGLLFRGTNPDPEPG